VIALFALRYGYARLLAEFLSAGIAALPFEAGDADHAGDIRAGLERSGQPIGWYDDLVAAQARARGAILVTANRREFERVQGLMVTDWTA